MRGLPCSQGRKGRRQAYRVGIAAELEVHAQHVVGLAVQQHGVGRMKRRVEPEAPLLRQLAGETDVSDQELVVKDLPGERQLEQVSHRAAYAIAGDQPVRFESQVTAVTADGLAHHRIGAVAADDITG